MSTLIEQDDQIADAFMMDYNPDDIDQINVNELIQVYSRNNFN